MENVSEITVMEFDEDGNLIAKYQIMDHPTPIACTIGAVRHLGLRAEWRAGYPGASTAWAIVVYP